MAISPIFGQIRERIIPAIFCRYLLLSFLYAISVQFNCNRSRTGVIAVISIHPCFLTADIYRIAVAVGIIGVGYDKTFSSISCYFRRIAIYFIFIYTIHVCISSIVIFAQICKICLPVICTVEDCCLFESSVSIPGKRYSNRRRKRITCRHTCPLFFHMDIHLRRFVGNNICLIGRIFLHTFYCNFAIRNCYFVCLGRHFIAGRSLCLSQSINASRNIRKVYGTACFGIRCHRNRLIASGSCTFQHELRSGKLVGHILQIGLYKREVTQKSAHSRNSEIYTIEGRIDLPILCEHIGQRRNTVCQIPFSLFKTLCSGIQSNTVIERIFIVFGILYLRYLT